MRLHAYNFPTFCKHAHSILVCPVHWCIRQEVKGPRELSFFPGVARGPIYEGFQYESEAGAHAGHIAFRPPANGASEGGSAGSSGRDDGGDSLQGSTGLAEWIRCRDYSNGGACFCAIHQQQQHSSM